MPFFPSVTTSNNPLVSQATVAGGLFGPSIYTYTAIARGPNIGPLPRLAQAGLNNTQTNVAGTNVNTPSYAIQEDYKPDTFEYGPSYNPSTFLRPPTSIGVGSNGRELVGTYEPHDNTLARYTYNQNRRATNWQQQSFPPHFRPLLQYQQVMQYQIQNMRQSATPIAQNNYFFGYQVTNTVQSQIGQNALGSLGG